MPAVPLNDPPPRSLLVLYGSETGNAADLAHFLGQAAARLRFDTVVEEMNVVELSSLLKYSLVILVLSTTGQGDMPRNALALWKKLLRKKLAPGCLARVRFTTFGLGDSSYPKYNWAAKKVHKRLDQLGAAEFYPRGEGDERHNEGIDTIWLPWITGLRQHLLDNWPLPSGLLPIPDGELLPPQFPLVVASSTADTTPPGADSTTALVPDAIPSTLISNERVTPQAHFQDVRLLRLDLVLPPSTSITPGDCITIFPSNPPSTVSRMLQLQPHWPADVPVLLPETLPSGLYSPRTTTLRALLTNHLDPAAVPRRSFLAALAPFTTDEYQRERLLEFADPKYADELYDYTTRPRRTILEVLEEFDSVRIPAERILDVFPVLRGRDFSVANHVVASAGSPIEVQVEILVALVKYRTILRIPRVGLCSAYLSPLVPPQPLMVAYKPSPSPLAFPSSRPVIAIATGTGVAPMRAFIQARHGPTATAAARTVLFFGCRSKEADNHFADEWSHTDGLHLVVAFSRDQAHKVYVQDAIRSQARVVAEMVRQNAVVCLCGGSARMAEACRNAIRDALLQESVTSDMDEAKAMVAKLDWWQEIWS